MNVLIIPEDFRHDQYVLKPIIQAMLEAAGKPRANVRVCMDPLLGGVDQAMNWDRLDGIIERYRGMVQILILAVDRDGVDTRRAGLDGLEARATAKLGEPRFYAENAWQEIEVWAIAGHDLPPDWSWNAIRTDRDPKERYFVPLAASRGLQNEPGAGRKTLALEAARNYKRVRERCTEDIAALENRLAKKFE
jgi:hypothetical protein